MIRLQTLGAVRLSGAKGELLAGRRKELALLAYLLDTSGRASRDELATLLWSERPQAKARHSLRQALLRIRRALPISTFAVDGESMSLDRTGFGCDADQFVQLILDDRSEEALVLWQGDFLPGFDDVGGEPWQLWLQARRDELAAHLAGALERAVSAARMEGRSSEARTWAGRWVDHFPLDEHPRAVLIGLLREEGQRAEALLQHDAFIARLARELEAEPSTAFRELRTALEEEPGLGSGPGPGSIALFTPVMVGRELAMASLVQAWEAVYGGEGVVVLVEGETGIGKTLLCEEFLRDRGRAPEAPLVFRGRAHEGQVVPGADLRELLTPLGAAPGIGGVSDGTLAILSGLVPALARRYSGAVAADDSSGAQAAAVREAFEVVSEEVPVIVFLDDVTLMDEGSRTVLLPLLVSPPGATLVLATLPSRHDLAQLPPAIGGGGRRHLRLGALGPDEMDALLAGMLELSAPDRAALAQRLHAECGGNPFYAIELVWGLVDEGLLVPDARGIWRTTGPDVSALPLPRGLLETVRRRLAGLPDDAVVVAACAAGMPPPVEVAALARATGLPSERFQLALGDLFGRRLLREPALHPGRVEFIHPVVGHVALVDLSHRAPTAPGRAASEEAAPGGLSRLAPPVPDGRPPRAGLGWMRRRGILVGAAVLALVVSTAVLWQGRNRALAPRLLAIGALQDLSGRDERDIGATVADMLATNLARVPGLQVVSSARIYEILGQLAPTEDRPAALARAALQAGATTLVEGSVLRGPRGLSLDLRVVDLTRGTVEDGVRVDGDDVFTLVDLATPRVARGLGLASPDIHVAEATTGSLVAYRFYEEGLRRFAGSDFRTALQLFDDAVAEDSAFAMATFYAWRARRGLGLRTTPGEMARMLRLAEGAPPRERLLIRGSWALVMSEPMISAVADTLAIRYPAEPEGQYLVGVSRLWEGDFPEALIALERVVALDSLGLRGTRPPMPGLRRPGSDRPGPHPQRLHRPRPGRGRPVGSGPTEFRPSMAGPLRRPAVQRPVR